MQKNSPQEISITFKLNKMCFSIIELMVVAAILAMLMTLLTGSFRSINSRAETLECQNKLRHYSSAYQYYLEDNENLFPKNIRFGTITGQVHWYLVRRQYPEMFVDQDSIICPTFSELWSSKTNYRGYTGIHLKSIFDLKNSPSQIGLIGDGIKSNITNGYCYFVISGITQSGLARDIDAKRNRTFHQDDFIHSESRINTSFVDYHVESLEPFEVFQRKDQIWDN